MLSTAATPIRALIVGGRGGIGSSFSRFLLDLNEENRVLATSRDWAVQEQNEGNHPTERYHQLTCNPSNRDDFEIIVDALHARQFSPNLILSTAGALKLPDGTRPESAAKKITNSSLSQTFEANVYPHAFLLAALSDVLKAGGETSPKERECVVACWSARVGSIGDNSVGGWYSYRAAKAAVNSLVKTGSIEYARTFPRVCLLSVHPGTVQTQLSEPFVGKEKQKSLVTDAGEWSPEKNDYGYFTSDVAARLMWDNVLSKVEPKDTGCYMDYGGRKIPW